MPFQPRVAILVPAPDYEEKWQGAFARKAAALTAAPLPPVYARVDMVGDAAGRLLIMELELIEPSLFLHHAADKGAALGWAE